LKDMLLIVLSVSLAAVAQLLLKLGMTKVGKISSLASAPSMLVRALLNPTVLSGLAVFAISALSWLVVLSRVRLSIAYPMVSLGYIVTVFFAWRLLQEPIRPITIVGCLTIMLGVFIVSRGI